jgi:gamma-glutamyltranspeptidase/glutathione hydrolase
MIPASSFRLPRPAMARIRPRASSAVLLLAVAGCGAPAAPAADPAAAAGPTPRPAATEADAPLFPARNRPDVRGARGAVVSDHPLATAAGYEILLRGGSAVDAAVATAAVLAVVRPHMNGVGGDAFALIQDGPGGPVHGLNGSGAAGSRASPEFFARGGGDGVPYKGPASVTVPGAVHAWTTAHERFGALPLADVLAPAVRLAREGFPVSTRLASDFAAQGDDLAPAARARFLPGGAPPTPGTLLRNPELAAVLEAVGRDGADAFYRGRPARAITDFLAARGGHLDVGDFARHRSRWVEPLRTAYLDHTFLALPPNTQGLAQLQQMQMARHFDLASMGHNTPEYLHTLVEIKKRAFADRDRWVADPEGAELPVAALLDPGYLRHRAREIDPDRAAPRVAPGAMSGRGDPGAGPRLRGSPVADRLPREAGDGDTVYLTVVDERGMAVSWIQSLFAGFGSGLMEPSTGVVLQNRGALFTLEPGHPNRVAPGKRPFHTLTPLMALRDGELAFTLGTPGGDGQTQSLLQIVHNLLLFDMTPQAAVEAPRYRSYGGVRVSLEDRIGPGTRRALTERGHELRVVRGWSAVFGGAQMIRVDPASGTLFAAADPRREAYAIAY